MTWLHLALSALSALVGGFIGGCTVAFRIGRKLAELEGRIAANAERLARGDKPVGDVPILKTRVETMIEEFRLFKRELREDLGHLVRREECDRRHEADGT